METTTIEAEVRESRGKGPARRLRAAGKLPAVFYGPGLEPITLTLDPKPLKRALLGTYRRNTVFTLKYDGNEALGMVKDITVHPVTREPLHVDFYKITEDSVVNAIVPFYTDGRAAGVVAGGILNVTRRDIPLRCKPGLVPAEIRADISKLNIGDAISVADLDLADGIEVTLKPNLTLAMVSENRRAKPGEEGEGDAAGDAATS